MQPARKLLIPKHRRTVEKSTSTMIDITEHPLWVKEMIKALEPYEKKVVNHVLFTDIQTCKLSEKRFQGALINFFPLIRSFPQYLGVSLSKVPEGGQVEWAAKARDWLITNISQERCHTEWWRDFAVGFGVKDPLTDDVQPILEMESLNNYLWRVCTYGSFSEGISAANFAIEGATGRWTKSVSRGIEGYRNLPWTNITDNSLRWIAAHANYDDHHPLEALEIVKAFAITDVEQASVKRSAQRALEYYALALDACYKAFD